MIATNRRTIPLALALVALASSPSLVRAQGNIFNPYGNSGYADYREFATPSATPNPGLPGQARNNQEPVVGRPRSNSFQRYVDELDGVEAGTDATRRAGNTRLPYYEAYQQQNRLNNRVYKPNNTKANQEFEDRQRQRDAAYTKALEEKDLVKRSKLLRQLEQEAMTRPLTTARPKPTPAPSTSARALAPPAFSTAPPPTGSDRRSTAPPVPGMEPRRSTPSTSRAPSTGRAGSVATPAPRPTAPRPAPAPNPSSIPIPAPR